MELPTDILVEIKAFALPVTRPHWREGLPIAAIIKKHFKIKSYYNIDFDAITFSDPAIAGDHIEVPWRRQRCGIGGLN